MPRPTTKSELISLSQANFEKLFSMIDGLSEMEKNAHFAFTLRDKNIRDVLVHLYEWHQLLLNFINKNLAGFRAGFLPAPYNWRTYPAMNVRFWEEHQNTPLNQAVDELQQSHRSVMQLIGKFSDEQLFTKNYYDWTGNATLGSHIVSAMSSHYDWALKIIKKHKKTLAIQ